MKEPGNSPTSLRDSNDFLNAHIPASTGHIAPAAAAEERSDIGTEPTAEVEAAVAATHIATGMIWEAVVAVTAK